MSRTEKTLKIRAFFLQVVPPRNYYAATIGAINATSSNAETPMNSVETRNINRSVL